MRSRETRGTTAAVSQPLFSTFARHKPDDVSNDIEVALPETSLGENQAPAGDHPPITGPRMTRSTTVRLSATGHVRSFPQQESLRKKPPDEDEDSDSDTEPAVEAESLQVKRRAFECRVKSWRSSTCMGNRQSFTCSPPLSHVFPSSVIRFIEIFLATGPVQDSVIVSYLLPRLESGHSVKSLPWLGSEDQAFALCLLSGRECVRAICRSEHAVCLH